VYNAHNHPRPILSDEVPKECQTIVNNSTFSMGAMLFGTFVPAIPITHANLRTGIQFFVL